MKLNFNKSITEQTPYFFQSNLSQSNSELGGTGTTGFAIPLAFSNMFQKKNNSEKTAEKDSTTIKKPTSTMTNGGKVKKILKLKKKNF